ncbi:Cohesin subunit psc3 [Fulvia fulva]|uniref:Cohesin subunit psc3 n=1 Tax=Passalora fulva TaxID=5499 RepID=A0A9Q8P5S0_PASFU|nr:Cohesin subunit psc3 [Fulvia fulva]UJO14042.1 Cohesin subunit psc3 [Fulvia fulva]
MSTSTSPAPDATSTANRASSRVRKQPDHFTCSPFSSSKRKRGDAEDADADGDVDMDDEEDDEADQDPEDDEPAEEEIREKAKRVRKPKSSAPKKPALKKPKVNGTTTLPLRTAAKAPARKRASKKAKIADSADAEAAGGLYAELFGHGKTIEEVVAGWLQAFQEHEARALADVINFVLKSAGCNSKLSDHDIENPDSAAAKLTDLQDEYQATEPSDYPIIAKGKNAASFKASMCGLMHALIKSVGARGELMTEPELIENIHVWLSTMSSASNRSFRHTGAVCCLSVLSALCEITKDIAQKSAENSRHAENERKKGKGVNKERVKNIEQKARDAHKELQFAEVLLKDWFDTVFIHRYRDVDPVVRRDCIEALGDWIITYPDHFFDGQHLRYMGWLLSDENSAARSEVVKTLIHLYGEQSRIGGLKTFTERFRARLVEIATADTDLHIQVLGIELIEVLRRNDLLEPDDIDAVGRLVFHDNPKVRKAVAGFFSANVDDLYTSKLEELGGSEALEEVMPEANEDNFETPRVEWLRYKSLAEMLHEYDQDVNLPSNVERSTADGTLILHAAGVDSRFTLAADVLYDSIDDLKDWQALSGYLLFDHSANRANGVANDPLSQLKHECTLTENEEIVLLEVLIAVVRRSLTDLAEKISGPKTKLSKKQKEDLQDDQDEAVRNLSEVTPKLLKKFGDVPNTAGAVLRLGGVLALPSLQGLRQDSADSATLLDALRKQFMAHGTDEVLGPATASILHALSYDELDESALEKVNSLWEDVVGNLAELLTVESVMVRGATSHEELQALSNNLLRIVRLATVSNCTQALEDDSVSGTYEAIDKTYSGAIDFIIDLILRATPPSNSADVDAEDAALEDLVASRAAEAALWYFRWNIASVMTAVEGGNAEDTDIAALEPLATRHTAYSENLVTVMQSRRATEPVCHAMTVCLLELYTNSAVLRTVNAAPNVSDTYTVLILDMTAEHEKAIMKVFVTAEKEFAKLSGKKLEVPVAEAVNDVEDDDVDVDADPVDDDPLSDDDDEDETQPQTQASQQKRDEKLIKPILAEQRLCVLTSRLVHAIAGGVINDTVTRKRVERNKTKLGPNFKEVLAYLENDSLIKKATKAKPKPRAKPQAPAVTNGTSKKTKANPKSNAIVADDEMSDDIEDEEQEEAARQERELEDDNEREPEEDEEVVNGAPTEEESVLGD